MLQISNITISHGGHTFLEQCSFSLEGKSRKRIALLGTNGSGKSSLLKVMAGVDEVSAGTISLSRESIGYVTQEISLPEDQMIGEYMEALLEESWMSYKIQLVLEEVGLSEYIILQNITSLSGGEKVRLGIAIGLLLEPTILLLDEPTNHLDTHGLLWLGAFVQNFPGTIMLITHDRTFINTYMTELWEIDTAMASIKKYTGNYEAYLAEKERLLAQEVQEYEWYQKHIDEIVMWLKANEFHPKYQFSDRVLSRKKALENYTKNQPPRPVIRPPMSPLESKDISEQRLVKVVIQSKCIGDKSILLNKEIIVRTGDRIRISGPNGSGKSTLLKILSKVDKDFAGEYISSETLRIGYLAQEVALPKERKVLEYIREVMHTNDTTARGILTHFLFTAGQMEQRIGNLSFGEEKRLKLALILQDKPNLLILDEPTNHLDVQSREDLERFLATVQTMVVVTHDTYFAEKMGFSKEIEL
ncbi:MAG: ABC-F family ATP-binding cassette domain-containing protein [Candidatus Gracilibacteria bacterium]